MVKTKHDNFDENAGPEAGPGEDYIVVLLARWRPEAGYV